MENTVIMFENMHNMLGRLKKPAYEANMKFFREQYGTILEAMLDSVETGEDREAAAGLVATDFCQEVYGKYTNNGKIKAHSQVDLNFFMVYYVFPAILLTGHECGTILCDSLRDKWNATFKKTNIGYIDYDTIHSSFKEKIFGIF